MILYLQVFQCLLTLSLDASSPQNVPQLILQTIYISLFHLDAVAIVSALFSSISILVTALSVITQMMIMRKQSFMMIRFNVNGIGVKRMMTRRVKGIAKGISSILGVPEDAVEIERSQDLSAGGIGFVIEVDVNVYDNIDYQQLMQKAIDRGALAEMFRKYWKLEGVPVITGLECKMVQPVHQRVEMETSGSVQD